MHQTLRSKIHRARHFRSWPSRCATAAAARIAVALVLGASTPLHAAPALRAPHSHPLNATATVSKAGGASPQAILALAPSRHPNLNLGADAKQRTGIQRPASARRGSPEFESDSGANAAASQFTPIPEPRAFELLMLGLLGLAIATRLRRKV